jgi:hypothetical protein
MTKEWFRLEYQTRHGWRTMYDKNGAEITFIKSLDEAKIERTKAIKRHKPYGRDYTYRIVKVTEEVVA